MGEICGDGDANRPGLSRIGLKGIRPGACRRNEPPSCGPDCCHDSSPTCACETRGDTESDPPDIVDTGGAGASMFVTAAERNGQRAKSVGCTDMQ